MSTTKTAHVDPNAPKPTPWATPCIIHGDKVYLAGIVGRLASGQSGAGTIGDQTKQVLSTAKARLQYVGLDLRDIVSIQIFLTHYERDFDDMNKAYIATMPNDVPFPVRTCVGVASLPKGTEIEMTIIAGKRHGGASL